MNQIKYSPLYLFVGILVTGGLLFRIAIYFAEHEPDTAIVSPNRSSMISVSEKNSNKIIEFSENNKLSISKISIAAPISFNIDGNNMEQYMKALEKGVGHLKGTALPGENGNIVIFGHSSYYKNKPGNFKTVFAKLDNLAAGDNIQISYNGITYNYTINEQKIVEPNNLSVVSQDTSKKTLTLITCWPPKTTDKRMVIVANEN